MTAAEQCVRLMAVKRALGHETAAAFANAIACDVRTVRRWERGDVGEVSNDFLHKVSEVTGASWEWLARGTWRDVRRSDNVPIANDGLPAMTPEGRREWFMETWKQIGRLRAEVEALDREIAEMSASLDREFEPGPMDATGKAAHLPNGHADHDGDDPPPAG